jgi:hypothetical protein
MESLVPDLSKTTKATERIEEVVLIHAWLSGIKALLDRIQTPIFR